MNKWILIACIVTIGIICSAIIVVGGFFYVINNQSQSIDNNSSITTTMPPLAVNTNDDLYEQCVDDAEQSFITSAISICGMVYSAAGQQSNCSNIDDVTKAKNTLIIASGMSTTNIGISAQNTLNQYNIDKESCLNLYK